MNITKKKVMNCIIHDMVCCEFSLENEAFFQHCEESTAISGLFLYVAGLSSWLTLNFGCRLFN